MDKIVTSREKFDKIKKIIHKQDLQEISFEFIVGSLFPDILKNIKDRIHLAYTQGYLEGLQATDTEYIHYIKKDTDEKTV